MLITKSNVLFFKPKQNFLSLLLKKNSSKTSKISNHLFNIQLSDGTLPEFVFGNYLRDDYYYLKHLSSVIEKLSRRALKIDHQLANQLNYLSKDIIESEQDMQLNYKHFLINETHHKPGPAISSYVDYQQDMVNKAEFAAALSCILPCFWIYYQLGLKLGNNQFKANPYYNWIKAYKSHYFVEAAKALAETVGKMGDSSPELQEKILEAYGDAADHEFKFIDEKWKDFIKEQIINTNNLNKIA